MNSSALAVALVALSACIADVEGLTGDGGTPPRDDASVLDVGLDANAHGDAEPHDDTLRDDARVDAAVDASVDAGLVPPCDPVIISEADEDVTSAAIVADDTGWRIFRASDSPGAPDTRILEQRLDAVGQTRVPAAIVGRGSRVEAHQGGDGYAVVVGDTVIIGPTPERRVTPRTGGVIAYFGHPDGSHSLARWSEGRLLIDIIHRSGTMITGTTITDPRWRDVYAGAFSLSVLSVSELAVVGTTTASGNPLAAQVYRAGPNVPSGSAPLATVLPSADTARIVWNGQREEWLVAHSVQRPGTRYGDAYVTILTTRGATVQLQQPLGRWRAWYGAPISVATTQAGYALVWQTSEDVGGGTSGYNDYLLATHIDFDNTWTVESPAPPALAATGRVRPQVAWNRTTGEIGHLWIHRVGDFPPNAGRGQLIFQCARPRRT